MKKIGFLSFGHWSPSPRSGTRSAGDVLLQSIDLAVAAEEFGVDGAYFRAHHFARQLASPFPLLAALLEQRQEFVLRAVERVHSGIRLAPNHEGDLGHAERQGRHRDGTEPRQSMKVPRTPPSTR